MSARKNCSSKITLAGAHHFSLSTTSLFCTSLSWKYQQQAAVVWFAINCSLCFLNGLSFFETKAFSSFYDSNAGRRNLKKQFSCSELIFSKVVLNRCKLYCQLLEITGKQRIRWDANGSRSMYAVLVQEKERQERGTAPRLTLNFLRRNQVLTYLRLFSRMSLSIKSQTKHAANFCSFLLGGYSKL